MYQKVAGLLPAGFKDRQWDELLNSVGDDGIHWFRDFYYPLYNGDLGNTDPSHQGAALFNRYFELLVEYLPKVNSSYARGRLNRGEFLHFMSGAAQVDLENLAKDALHWNNEVALELEGARIEFPEVLALYRDPECTPESDAAFCSRLGATCGSKAGADNCGVTRTVASCGSCSAPETCGGGGTPNVCGGGSTDTPCAGLCAPATTFPQSFQSNDVGASASCHETTANLQGLACGASPGRIFTVNGTVIDCNGGVTLPEKRNGGYCSQWSAGNPGEWAWFSTW